MTASELIGRLRAALDDHDDEARDALDQYPFTTGPRQVLAMNGALRVVLDGYEQTLTNHHDFDGCCGYCSPCWGPAEAEVRWKLRRSLACRSFPCPDYRAADTAVHALADAWLKEN